MSAGPRDSRPSLPLPGGEPPPPELTRRLDTLDVAAIQIGNILGSGIFVAPAAVALALPGRPGALIWLAGGLIAACGAVVYAECGSRLPRSGGFYTCYLRVFGEPVAFVGGWAALLVTYPASIAAIALIFGRYLRELVPAAAPHELLSASAALAVVAAINIAGVRRAAWTSRVLTGIKIVALALVCLAAVLFAGEGSPVPVAAAAPPGSLPDAAGAPSPVPPIATLLGAMVVVLWTYDGWSDVSMVAGEIRDPARSLGRAVLISMGVLAILYIAVQTAVGELLSPAEAAASASVLSDAVVRGLGPGSGRAVALLIVIATFGSVHGIILAASRLGFAMARDGVFFGWFGSINPALGTPARAIAFLSVASIIYVFVATFRNLLAFFSFTVWIFYALTATGVLLMRARKIGTAPGWKAPGAGAAPWILIATGAAMASGLFVESPGRSLTGIALLAAGFPVHALWRRMVAPRPGPD